MPRRKGHKSLDKNAEDDQEQEFYIFDTLYSMAVYGVKECEIRNSEIISRSKCQKNSKDEEETKYAAAGFIMLIQIEHRMN